MRGKILIVEDERIIQILLREYLSKCGFEVVSAYDGNEGLAMLNKDSMPNMVILDILLPKLSGFELYKTIKAKEGEIKTFIIITSEVSTCNGTENIKDLEVDAIFTKPYSLLSLRNKILSLFEQMNHT